MREIGATIVEKSHYARQLLSGVKGVSIPLSTVHFNEFVVSFDGKKSVKQINKKLLKHKIFGGRDISKEFPDLGNSAIYCISEMHSKADIDRLGKALKEVLS